MSKKFTAVTYLKNRQFSQAVTLLEKHLLEQPEDSESLDLLGRAYFELHKYQDAYDTFAKLHRLDQTNIEWTHLLARCLYCLGNFKKAYALASYVVKHEGPTENNLMTRGLSAQKGGLKEEAEADFRSILKGNPIHADSLHNLATLVAAKKQFVEAIQLFEKSYNIDPTNKAALANAIYYARSTSAWIVERTYASEIESLGVEGGVISPFSMLALDDNPSRHQARSREFWQNMTQGIERCLSGHPPSDKIKVGYFSSDFYDHATMHLFADVLRYHDRGRFEIFGYVIKNPKMDQISREALALFDHVKDVSTQTDRQIAEIARADQIDIAVDLKGFTSFSRPAIFAYGAGKVQINYLGYPGTMGTPLMDYIIADQVVIPPSHEQYYDESVLRLPNCYQPNRELRPDQASLSRSDFGLPSDAVVLASFNAIYKVGLQEFLIWLEILKKHPQTVLWIISDVEQAHLNLLNLAEQQGVSSDRIIRATPVAHHAHIARLSLADLFVDTFNVCAHTTASDALRAGLPVITKMGCSFASRVASSILHSCELDDWIAHSEEEYFEKIDKYLRSDDLETQKTKVRDAVAKSDLFRPDEYTKDLERLYLHTMARIQKPSDHGVKDKNDDVSKVDAEVYRGRKQNGSVISTGQFSKAMNPQLREKGQSIDVRDCTFCMPTNRDFVSSKRSLESLINLKSKGFNVVVSDNSGDSRKMDFLKDHGISVTSGPKDGLENWQNVIEMTTTPFMSMIGDDDWVDLNLDEVDRYVLGELSPNCVGFRPETMLFNPQRNSTSAPKNFEIAESAPLKRILSYGMAAKGTNETYYSVWKSQSFKKVNEIIKTSNPLRGSWMDWSVVWALLSTGKLQTTAAYRFNYNIGNWSTAESISSGVERSLLDVGLEHIGGENLRILQSLDFLGLALRLNSELGVLSRSCAQDIKYWFLAVLGVCDLRLSSDPQTEVNMKFNRTFDFTIKSVETMRPGLGEEYKRFCELA